MSRFSLDASELPTLGRKGLFDSGIGFSHTFRIVREKIRYVFIMEIEKVPPDLTEQQILNCLEKTWRKQTHPWAKSWKEVRSIERRSFSPSRKPTSYTRK